MLAWYRLRSRALASVLLVGLSCLTAATGMRHHDDCHETVCVSAAVHHNPADHSFEGPPAPDDHPLHCVVCHWIRAFKPVGQAVQSQTPSTADDVLVHAPFVGTPASFPAAQPPLRSPPATPAFA
jgi:hypothetical protein